MRALIMSDTPGLVRCDKCGEAVKDLGRHYSVHFPRGEHRPCERSWPPPMKKAEARP